MMRKFVLLLSGVVLGFVGAHFVNQTTEGRRFFDRLNRGIAEFNRAFAAGYHEGEDEDADIEAALRTLQDKQ